MELVNFPRILSRLRWSTQLTLTFGICSSSGCSTFQGCKCGLPDHLRAAMTAEDDKDLWISIWKTASKKILSQRGCSDQQKKKRMGWYSEQLVHEAGKPTLLILSANLSASLWIDTHPLLNHHENTILMPFWRLTPHTCRAAA